MIPMFLSTILINFCVGYFCGWIRGRLKRNILDEKEKQDIYCAGWEDSIYNLIEEYDRQYYIKQRAIEGFKEFQCSYKKVEPH